jgi:hypothetical protein
MAQEPHCSYILGSIDEHNVYGRQNNGFPSSAVLDPSAGGSYMSGPPRGASKDRKAWPDSIVVMQGTANPSTPVRFRLRPPFLAPKTPKIAHCLTCGLLCCGKAEGLLL